jgi:lysophospholipase
LAGLVDLPTNPVPRGAVSGLVRTPDGIDLRYARFPPTRPAIRGTVIILHGRAEFIEKYFETVGDLRRRAFAVVAFDWRGQGGSGRLLHNPRKGHVRDFEDYVTDFRTVLNEVALPDCPPPYYVLAHSTGGAVALLASGRVRSQVERMILTAPLLALRRVAPHRMERLTGLAHYVGLGESFLPGSGATLLQTRPFADNQVTSDPDRYARTVAILDKDPSLGIGGATIGWLNAAMRAARRIAEPDFAAEVPIPLLIAIAGADTVVSNPAIERLSMRLRTGAHVRVPGAKHEILMEQDKFRDQFWAAFDAFIPGRSP